MKTFPLGAYGQLLRGAMDETSIYGDCYAEEWSGLQIRWESGRLERLASDTRRACSIRTLSSGDFKTSLWCVDGWQPERLRLLMRSDRDPRSFSTAAAPALREPSIVERSWEALDPAENHRIDEKVALLKSLDTSIRQSALAHIRQVTLSYGESQGEIIQLTGDGTALCEKRPSVTAGIYVLAEKNGIIQSAYESCGALGGWENLAPDHLKKLALEVTFRALQKLDAPRARGGEFPVVIASSAGGTFLHEAIGHSLEFDAVIDGVSPVYRGRRGRVVAPEFITIVDDPTLPGRRGSYFFDDEAVPALPAVLVENGVLKDYLTDRASSGREGGRSNGHGRREGARCRPLPRMSNIYIKPGSDDPQAIVRSVNEGLLVTRMGGGQVNTATGQFMFQVEEGYWIVQGEPKHMVRDANLLGVGEQALGSIKRLGRDLGWSIGVCGKDGQNVPVTDGLPTMLIEKMLLGGTAE
ncbi:MAG: TldD/PmbA family protein [Elusimicrobia bacterium]|nr:TldD/PmbA family protein [Elusimicrobiota bacterium]